MNRKKSLSPKLHLKRITVNLPTDTFKWLQEKAKIEEKSLSYLLTELLEKIKKEEGEK